MEGKTDQYSCAIVTMSDKGAQGLREDTSGLALREILENEGYRVIHYEIIPDDSETIKATLIHLADTLGADLIVTTGGTGVSPTDVTPEATMEVIEKPVPGLAEAMRTASLAKTIHAVLSRGVTGIRGESLIINLPGSKKAALENIEVVLAALPHAIDKIKGSQADCADLK